MKLRLKSHSVRFRVTSEDMEQLRSAGRAACTTVIPAAGGDPRRFIFAVQTGAPTESEMQISADGFTLILGAADWQTLNSDDNEGVYLRREWQDEQGRSQRTVIYVEKDMKAHKNKEHKKKHHKDKHHENKHHKDRAATEGGGMES